MTGFTLKSSKPETLAPFSLQVFDTLARYTAFPWPVMLAQCKRANLDPAALTPQDLAKVLDLSPRGLADSRHRRRAWRCSGTCNGWSSSGSARGGHVGRSDFVGLFTFGGSAYEGLGGGIKLTIDSTGFKICGDRSKGSSKDRTWTSRAST